MAIAPPLVFAFARDDTYAQRLATAAGLEMGAFETRDFPDGETYLRFESNPASRPVVLVGTLNDPNARILPLLLLADAARQCGAASVGLVAPYLAYMRQDARFRDGEAVTSRSFAAIVSRGFDWLVTVEPHLHRIHTLSEIYDIPTDVVDVAPALGEWVARHVRDPILIGPDDESRQWVGAVAAAANVPFLVLSKVRRGDSDVDVSVPGLARYHEKTPVLVDDIISTGVTMTAAVRHLRDARAPAPVCLAVHAVFAAGARIALDTAGAGVVATTNTIPHASNAIDTVPAVAAALRLRLATLAD